MLIRAYNCTTKINTRSDSPIKWKRSTLTGLVRRAFKICSNDRYLKTELQHLKQVFHNENGYPAWLINKTIQVVRAQCSKTN